MTDLLERPVAVHYLVGDRFVDFARTVDAWTVSDLVEAVHEGRFPSGAEAVELRVGQGVDEYALAFVRSALRRLADESQVHLVASTPVLADRHELHKMQVHNVLVADLRQVTEGEFRASLRVHNDNELMADAGSRAHLPGMLPIEASRQLFVAVAERYLLPSLQRRHYLVITSMRTEFQGFLFPVQAELVLRVLEAVSGQDDRMAFTVQVDVVQADRCAATTVVEFAAFEAAVVAQKEQRRARQTLQAPSLAATGR